MKKAAARALQRDRFVEIARLRRILAAFEGLHDGDSSALQIEVEDEAGKLVENDGEGNHVVASWNAAGVVALEYIHDEPDAHGDTSPEPHLKAVPRELADLAAATASFGPRLATRAAWALGNEASGEWRDMHLLEAYTRPPEEALELQSSLGAMGTALVMSIAEATRSGTYTMTDADADAVFGKKAPKPNRVEKAVKELEKTGVYWPGAVERAKTLAAALAHAPPKLAKSKGAMFAEPIALSMMPRGSLQRDRFVNVARVRRLLDAFEGVHGGPLDELDVETDGDTGRLIETGKGQIVTACWNAVGVVALAFGNPAAAKKAAKPRTDKAKSGKDKSKVAKSGPATPDAKRGNPLDELPAALADLAPTARSLGPGDPVDAVWTLRAKSSRSCPLGIARLECYTWKPEDILSRACVMAPKLGELILRAERATRAGTYTVTEDDAKAILANRFEPHPENAVPAIRALERAGVLWPGMAERTQRAFDEKVAARKLAEEPLQTALLRAAHDGDLVGVRAALDAGAVVDCRTYEDMFVWNIVGASPLWFALRKWNFEMAELLVRAGADVNRAAKNGCPGDGKCSPLRLAAAAAHPGLVRMLLERGADVDREHSTWGVLRAVVDGCGWRSDMPTRSPSDFVEVIRMLLDAGAPLPDPGYCEALRDRVVSGGAPELAERLVPLKRG